MTIVESLMWIQMKCSKVKTSYQAEGEQYPVDIIKWIQQ